MHRPKELVLISKADQCRQAHYLESSPFTLWVKNTLAVPIMLDQIQLTFQSSYPVPPAAVTSFHNCGGKSINPSAVTPIRVVITPNLLFMPDSNPIRQMVADICIQQLEGPIRKSGIVGAGSDYLNIRDAELFEQKQVFVSYRDDEDLVLAELAKTMLMRAGFTPYLARDDCGTGALYWEAKILPAIRSSIGTLVIWTHNTAARPSEVLRELRYSREVHTPVGLFRGDEAGLPPDYPAHKLEYQAFTSSMPWVPFASALEAAARRHERGLPLFLDPENGPNG